MRVSVNKAHADPDCFRNGESAVCACATQGNDTCLQLLLRYKANIETGRPRDGASPLSLAAQKGQVG